MLIIRTETQRDYRPAAAVGPRETVTACMRFPVAP
jgi:hypothetical protein